MALPANAIFIRNNHTGEVRRCWDYDDYPPGAEARNERLRWNWTNRDSSGAYDIERRSYWRAAGACPDEFDMLASERIWGLFFDEEDANADTPGSFSVLRALTIDGVDLVLDQPETPVSCMARFHAECRKRGLVVVEQNGMLIPLMDDSTETAA